MDWALLLLAFSLFFLWPAAVLFRRRRRYQLPPGPAGWPVFGNMFDLGSMPHKTTAGLKRDYGPVVWLRIGSINTMVLLTAKSAAEFFKNHDVNFADRKITDVMKACDFHQASVSLSPYGPYWRAMKRIMTVEMLVQRRIVETEPIRRRCIADMADWIGKEDGARIHVSRFAFLAAFNMLGNLMLSRDLVSPDSVKGSEFYAAMVEFMEWSGHPNVADLFPCLRRIDPQGLRRRAARGMGKTLEIVAEFVKERRANGPAKDFLEVLLEERNRGEKISDNDMNILILELFLAGSETMSSSTEWALVELLTNAETMNKAKTELLSVVGKGERFEERHIEDLPYLQAVVKETLRLHPPIPFLVPRKAIEDTKFMGYDIPKETQVFINTWAIGRDEKCWDDPLTFRPERFMGGGEASGIDYRGQNFELIPFGAGRRICTGIPLAHRMLHLVVGTLLHEFDWSVDKVGKDGLADARERMGVTVRKLVPLQAVPRKRWT